MAPEQTLNTNASFFKDANLAVTSMQGINVSGNTKVQLSFTTIYEKNISKIEVMAGDSPNYLCSISEINLSSNSSTSKTYTVIDNNPKTQTVYYLLKYSLNNGDWGYTGLYKFQRSN